MDDLRFGQLCRAARIRRGWRQLDVARRAGVSRDVVSLLERGGSGRIRLDDIRRVALALEVDVDLRARWRGGEGEHLISRRHSDLGETFAQSLVKNGWEPRPEVSFSIWGERGVIDLLGWHASSGYLLLVEIKTELVDVGELLGTLDRKRRLAPKVAADLGLPARAVGTVVVLLDTSTNHRRLAHHATLVRSALPDDGRRLRGWLREPAGPLAALTFLSSAAQTRTRTGSGGIRRVSVSRNAVAPGSPRSARRGTAGHDPLGAANSGVGEALILTSARGAGR